MKETYYRKDNIGEAAAAVLEEMGPYALGARRAFRPGTSALLILDMQEYFIDPASHAAVPSAEAIIPVIASLAEAYMEAGLPVIMTRHLNTDADAGMLAKWWEDLIREDEPGSIITGALRADGAVVVEKTQYDAFHMTRLGEILSGRGTETLVITGVMTHLCVESTARSAFVKGYEVFIPADAVATYSRELHVGSLRGLAHGFAHIGLSGDILEAVTGA